MPLISEGESEQILRPRTTPAQCGLSSSRSRYSSQSRGALCCAWQPPRIDADATYSVFSLVAAGSLHSTQVFRPGSSIGAACESRLCLSALKSGVLGLAGPPDEILSLRLK